MDKAQEIRGVNLGNWLVLEKWMNPGLFAGTDAEDEYHLARALPAEQYAERMHIHRAEYITERDFALLAELGVNAVRIPVPFFLFGDRPPYIGCVEQLDAVFDWAEKWGLRILIDLHTVPGSQNGFDNGGICGVCRWAAMPQEVDFVLNLLERIAKRYGQRPALWGIQPLNEPITTALLGEAPWEQSGVALRYPARDAELAQGSAAIPMAFLQWFYQQAYQRLRRYLPVDKAVVLHDAFCLNSWKEFLQSGCYENVVLDAHLYLSSVEMAGCEQTPEGYSKAIRENFGRSIREVSAYAPVLCGEWCLDNALARSMPRGAAQDALYRMLAQTQLETWAQGVGSFYWSYKLLNQEPQLASWDFLHCVCSGWLPGWKNSSMTQSQSMGA